MIARLQFVQTIVAAMGCVHNLERVSVNLLGPDLIVLFQFV